MAFTEDEERIVRLIIDELRTRKKLDAARRLKDTDLRAGIKTVQQEVDTTYAATISALQQDYNVAEQAIVDEFK
jgi:hypothetical protein